MYMHVRQKFHICYNVEITSESKENDQDIIIVKYYFFYPFPMCFNKIVIALNTQLFYMLIFN